LDILAAAAAEQQAPLEPVSSWRQFWRSPQWHAAVRTYEALTLHNFAMEGTQAVAVALWALVLHWGQPEQAIMMAAAFGGNASTTTALTGEVPGSAGSAPDAGPAE
jgi:ADP-ribosylglycohydrolase